MKKMIMFFVVSAFIAFAFIPANAGNGPGPAPNSGDCIPDGSGWPETGTSPGPAPNSGDGIPDGSGFPAPPSPGPGNGN